MFSFDDLVFNKYIFFIFVIWKSYYYIHIQNKRNVDLVMIVRDMQRDLRDRDNTHIKTERVPISIRYESDRMMIVGMHKWSIRRKLAMIKLNYGSNPVKAHGNIIFKILSIYLLFFSSTFLTQAYCAEAVFWGICYYFSSGNSYNHLRS